MVMRIVMITPSGRETSRSSGRPLVRTLRKSPHQANHGYLTRLLPGLFLPAEKRQPNGSRYLLSGQSPKGIPAPGEAVLKRPDQKRLLARPAAALLLGNPGREGGPPQAVINDRNNARLGSSHAG